MNCLFVGVYRMSKFWMCDVVNCFVQIDGRSDEDISFLLLCNFVSYDALRCWLCLLLIYPLSISNLCTYIFLKLWTEQSHYYDFIW